MRTEWLLQHETGDTTPMALAERVKQLRTEHHWSQGDLAERIDADPAQISRYENGRITPSADAIIRLAETFGVSCDYLLVDGAPADPSPAPKTPSATNSTTSQNSTPTTSNSSPASSTPSSPKPASATSPPTSASDRHTLRRARRLATPAGEQPPTREHQRGLQDAPARPRRRDLQEPALPRLSPRRPDRPQDLRDGDSTRTTG